MIAETLLVRTVGMKHRVIFRLFFDNRAPLEKDHCINPEVAKYERRLREGLQTRLKDLIVVPEPENCECYPFQPMESRRDVQALTLQDCLVWTETAWNKGVVFDYDDVVHARALQEALEHLPEALITIRT